MKKDIDRNKKKKNKNDSDSDSELVSEVRTSKNTQKPGFALLAISDEEDAPITETKEESDDDIVVETTKTSKKEKGGKKGKKKRKDEEDEEDIEQMLAELEIEYSGGNIVKAQSVEVEGSVEEGVEDKKKKKKKKKVEKDIEVVNTEEVKESNGDEEEIGTMKSAAQKKKEKKEREKQKKLDAKKMASTCSMFYRSSINQCGNFVYGFNVTKFQYLNCVFKAQHFIILCKKGPLCKKSYFVRK